MLSGQALLVAHFLPVDVWGACPETRPRASMSHRLFVPNMCSLVMEVPIMTKERPFTAPVVVTYPKHHAIGQDMRDEIGIMKQGNYESPF
jgi:hypothetical protein